MKKVFIVIAGIIIPIVLGRLLIRDLDDKLYNEYKRGLMDGGSYYQKHGEFPSYWHWNHKYADPEFNIDTVLVFNKDSLEKEIEVWKRKVDNEFFKEHNIKK